MSDDNVHFLECQNCKRDEPAEVDSNEPPKWMVVGAVLLMSVGLMTIGYWAIVLFDKFLSLVEGT